MIGIITRMDLSRPRKTSGVDRLPKALQCPKPKLEISELHCAVLKKCFRESLSVSLKSRSISMGTVNLVYFRVRDGVFGFFDTTHHQFYRLDNKLWSCDSNSFCNGNLFNSSKCRKKPGERHLHPRIPHDALQYVHLCYVLRLMAALLGRDHYANVEVYEWVKYHWSRIYTCGEPIPSMTGFNPPLSELVKTAAQTKFVFATDFHFRRGRFGLRPGPVPYGPELFELVSFYEWNQFGPLAEMYSVRLEYPEVRDLPLPNYGEDYVSRFPRPGGLTFPIHIVDALRAIHRSFTFLTGRSGPRAAFGTMTSPVKQPLHFPEDLESSISLLENTGESSFNQLIYDVRRILSQMERIANRCIKKESISSSESKKRKRDDNSFSSNVEEMYVPAARDLIIGESNMDSFAVPGA